MRHPILVPIVSLVMLVGCGKPGGGAPGNEGATTSGAVTALGVGFEGQVSMHLATNHGPPMDLLCQVKAPKLRIELPAAMAMHAVFDQSANKTYAFFDNPRLYLEADEGARVLAKAAKVTETGKHETIAGTDCEDWDIAEPSGARAAVCVARGIEFFDIGVTRPDGGVPTTTWIDQLEARKAFPVKAVETDASGKETSRLEVTKIEKKSLENSLFAIPPGYTSLAPLMQGLNKPAATQAK